MYMFTSTTMIQISTPFLVKLIANFCNNQLDHLTVTLFKLSHDIFDICGSLWGKRIKIFQSQLQKRLRDYAQGKVSHFVVIVPWMLSVTSGVIRTPWPSLGQLLFFQMVSKIFSTSDYRHIIVESACLFLCQCLSQCPVNSIPDLSSGNGRTKCKEYYRLFPYG